MLTCIMYYTNLAIYCTGVLVFLRYLIHFIIYSINWPTKVKNIPKKCVLITGCDHGLGLVTLRFLDSLVYEKSKTNKSSNTTNSSNSNNDNSDGCVIFAACLTEEGCQRIRNKCSSKVHPIRMDITDSTSIQEAADWIQTFLANNATYQFWGVVNIAGILNYNLFADWDNIDDATALMNVNYLGTLRVTKAFLPLLKASKGRIINTTSGVTVIGKMPLFSTYGASKAATRFYTETLRIELGLHWGVTVHEICPGGLATPMTSLGTWNKMRERAWNNLDKETRDEYGEEMHSKTVCIDENITTTEGCSEDLSAFSSAIEHALFSKYPKSRYLISNAYPFMYIMGLLPDNVCDWIWTKIIQHRYGLPISTTHAKSD